jgi:hypothetical protein
MFIKKYKNIYFLQKKHFKLIKDNAFGGLFNRESNKKKYSNYLKNLKYLLLDE